MKELSREEQLRRQIAVMEDACEKKKWQRVKKTFLILCGVIYLGTFIYDEIEGIENFLTVLICTPFIAGFVIFLSLMVLLYIIHGASQDAESIAKLKGELNSIEFNKYK